MQKFSPIASKLREEFEVTETHTQVRTTICLSLYMSEQMANHSDFSNLPLFALVACGG